ASPEPGADGPTSASMLSRRSDGYSRVQGTLPLCTQPMLSECPGNGARAGSPSRNEARQMIDTRIPPPAQTGELLVSLFVGADNVDDVSQALNLPLGQVAAWCERIRTAFEQPIDES